MCVEVGMSRTHSSVWSEKYFPIHFLKTWSLSEKILCAIQKELAGTELINALQVQIF